MAVDINEQTVLRQLCKYFKVNYTQFADVWAHKFIWQRRLWNEMDALGFNNRVCRDVANMILSEDVRIWTENPNINRLIESDMKGRLKFDSIFAKNLTHCMGIGDMLMIVYIDPLDNKPCISYVPGYNIIPISFNEHNCTELAWFTSTKVDDKIYIVATVEKLKGRELYLFEYGNAHLMAINYGTPIWARVMGGLKPVYNYKEKDPIRKFAWVSTGLNNLRWIDTPFHNSFIWPITISDTLLRDWTLLDEEYKNSMKRIFLSPELVKRTFNVTDANGTPIPMKKIDPTDTLFECVSMNDELYREWNPTIRLQEYVLKIKFDLEMFGTAVGLGPQMYNFDHQKIEMTATQVIMSNRDAINTINNIKKELIPAVQIVTKALIWYWFQMGLLAPEDIEYVLMNDSAVHVKFDDGVFVNRSAKVQEGLQLYGTVGIDGSRLISKWDLLTQYCGYPEDTARAMMERSQEEVIQYLMFQIQTGQFGS